MAKVTINDLLEAGCHFGHQTRRWNPRMKKFVYGAKNGITIIDLTKTMRQIADACNFLQKVVIDGGDVLFVGTKRQIRDVVKELAAETNMYCVSERWLGGTLTNNVTIRKSIAKMAEIDATLNSESVASMKKKEVASLTRHAQKLHRDLDGIAAMKKLPAALVIIDVCNEINAVREANKLNIPIVAIVDTNGDPSTIDYPVAANDDAVKSVSIITGLFREAIKIANEIHLKKVAEEREAAEAAKRLAQEKADDEEKAEKAAKLEKKPAVKKTAAKKAEPKAEKTEAEAPKAEVKAEAAAEETAEAKPAAKKPAAKKPAAKKAEPKAEKAETEAKPAAKKPAAKKPAAKKAEPKAE
jgi:small subunit ribosomal protein S2